MTSKAQALLAGRDFDLVKCAQEQGALPTWPGFPEHVGVWLERCYHGELEDGQKPRRRALYDLAIEALRPGCPAVKTYATFFERWKREVLQGPNAHRCVIFEATSRVLLHPSSNASITDASVLLHHTYGVPYLPGSGLKGLARAWMRRAVNEDERLARKQRVGDETWAAMRSDARDQEIVRALFGYIPREGAEASEQGQGAAVEFLDALWVPEAPPNAPSGWSPLSLDVVNPHQSAYYTGNGEPADTNEPVPTHRLTISPGVRFLVVIEGQGERAAVEPWVRYAADELLAPALAGMGFGAWTSAGYGRFTTRSTAGAPGASFPKGSAVSTPDEWHEATVVLDPGSGRLSVAIPGNRVAEVGNPQAVKLREALLPELQERLKKKRSLKLKVRVEPNGRAWSIVELKG